VDFLAASRAAEWAGIHVTTLGRAGPVAPRNTISAWRGRRANRKTHRFRTRDTNGNPEARRDTNPDGDTDARGNTHAGSTTNTHGNPDTNSGAADVQPRLCHRDGERGVAQHYW
jgi:hypothetical protein